MKNILLLEEFAMFLLGIALFYAAGYAWWWFPALILTPDLSMAGYLVNSRVGAFCYNLVHHKGIAILFILGGFWWQIPLVGLTGSILFAHSSLDRLFGYGLKFGDSFKHTHLGWIGGAEKQTAVTADRDGNS